MAKGSDTEFNQELKQLRDDLISVEERFKDSIVGNEKNLQFILKALLCSGHVLLEGVPGIGKTLMVKTVARLLDLKYRRIQFTPDLMPADIVGTNIIVEDERGDRQFRFEKGPIFTNILLADEINRASPKTQSALLQCMEEREATVFGNTYGLDEIFITLATQNPIEMSGTYPLPEAQMDRFMFKLVIGHPGLEDLREIARLNTEYSPDSAEVSPVLSMDRVLEMRQSLARIPVTDRIYEFASLLVHRTNPGNLDAPEEVRRFVRYGTSPRGLNALIAASRVSAVMDGRVNIAIDDVEENLMPSLRHRIALRFEGEVEGLEPDTILDTVFRSLRSSF